MKKILLIAGGVIASVMTALYIAGSSEAPKDISSKLQELDKKFVSGEISEYEDARIQLSDLKAICEGYIVANEFSTDPEDVRKIAHYKTLVQRITEKEQQIAEEETLFNSIPWGSENKVERLERLSAYISTYPKGVKYHHVMETFKNYTIEFIEQMSDEFATQTQALERGETQPINSLFHMTNLNYSSSQGEEQNDVDITQISFDQALERYNQSKRVVTLITQQDLGELQMSVTPQTLRQQMEQYENQLKRKKERQETLFRKMIAHSIVEDGWDNKARTEMRDYVIRDRATGFLACDYYDLTINIAQAENYKINIFSDRVEVDLHYNVNSICDPTLKYKYYDGTFMLIFPVINGDFGQGYFKSRNITRTE